MKNLSAVLGKEFKSKLTGSSYGVFRERGLSLPAGFSVANFGLPVVEDDGGNLFTETPNGHICFWDHETDDLTIIASSWDEFVIGCVEPDKVKLQPGQVLSAWIDPEFAKKMGIVVSKDGWIKKKA